MGRASWLCASRSVKATSLGTLVNLPLKVK